MESLVNWYNSLDSSMQVFWGIAIVSSFIFTIQFILSFIGMDSEADVDFDVPDTDFDGDTMSAGGGLSLFSIRSLVNFFVGYGWAGVCLSGSVSNQLLLHILCIAFGMLLGSLWFIIRRQMGKLEHNAAFNVSQTVGKTCSVYLRIPASRQGKGKIQVSVGGAIHEIDALTDSETEIPTGATVQVIEQINSQTVLV